MDYSQTFSPSVHEAKQIEQQYRSVSLETRKLKTMKMSDALDASEIKTGVVETNQSADNNCIPDDVETTVEKINLKESIEDQTPPEMSPRTVNILPDDQTGPQSESSESTTESVPNTCPTVESFSVW